MGFWSNRWYEEDEADRREAAHERGIARRAVEKATKNFTCCSVCGEKFSPTDTKSNTLCNPCYATRETP